MFSGLTNQVSSWMGGTGKKDGEAPKEEEKLASPVADTQSGNNTEVDKKDASPTKGVGGRFDMLTNVKSQMTGWLSAGVPGLRRGDEENVDAAVAAVTGETKTDVESPASEKSVKGSPVEQQKEEDDNSSATGGADSDIAASEPGTPGEDKDGNALGGVSTKAIQGAKSIGNFLFSAVNKAGKTVSEASAKIKKTVEENLAVEERLISLVDRALKNAGTDPAPAQSTTQSPDSSLLGEFNKEQEAFIKEKQGKNSEAAVPPWVGCPNEESLKEECLTLSTDRRNFVRSPPAGVDFQFDYEVSYPIAMATLAEDPNLEKMRFELVPKVINEETFWRNYFYRVSLIRQANELSSMAQEGQSEPGSRANSTDVEPAAKPSHHHNLDAPDQASTDSPTHEFVSDNFRASSKDIEEVREGMKKLGLDPDKRNEEEWEKELEAELQDYEVVADGDGNAHQDSSNWENQIQEMLDAEDPTDLK